LCQAESLAIVPGTIPIASIVADSSTATGLAWAAPSGGGKVLQVIYGSTSTAVNVVGPTATDSTLSATITPSAATSKVLILTAQYIFQQRNTDQGLQVYLKRNGTTVFDPNNGAELLYIIGTSVNSLGMKTNAAITYLDSPNSTSALTYATWFNGTYGSPALANAQLNGTTSTIILMEIGA
jgi:hypothetical protein